MKFVPPSVHETAFNCPHCGALATQFWHSIRADRREDKSPLPVVISLDDDRDFKEVDDKEVREQLKRWLGRMKIGEPFFEGGKDGPYSFESTFNLNVSCCFNCKLWQFGFIIA